LAEVTDVAPPADAYSDIVSSVYPELAHVSSAYTSIVGGDYNIVHDHTMAGPVLASVLNVAAVNTLHRFVSKAAFTLLSKLQGVYNVALSDSQVAVNRGLPVARRIHSAVDLAAIRWDSPRSEHAVFAGRINPAKGPHLAIHAARQAGLPIRLAGRVAEPSEKEYFDALVRPLLGHDAEYVGELEHHECMEFLGTARVALFPVQWDEPFGLVVAEAAACGTPVVALSRGSIPEIVKDGMSGRVVDTAAEMPSAIASVVDSMTPDMCRKWAVSAFSPERFAAEYANLYRDVISGAVRAAGA
jgi:glycosyltransferase involved in cell wall biosynthesis